MAPGTVQGMAPGTRSDKAPGTVPGTRSDKEPGRERTQAPDRLPGKALRTPGSLFRAWPTSSSMPESRSDSPCTRSSPCSGGQRYRIAPYPICAASIDCCRSPIIENCVLDVEVLTHERGQLVGQTSITAERRSQMFNDLAELRELHVHLRPLIADLSRQVS